MYINIQNDNDIEILNTVCVCVCVYALMRPLNKWQKAFVLPFISKIGGKM